MDGLQKDERNEADEANLIIYARDIAVPRIEKVHAGLGARSGTLKHSEDALLLQK